jgi:hypothetical protein
MTHNVRPVRHYPAMQIATAADGFLACGPRRRRHPDRPARTPRFAAMIEHTFPPSINPKHAKIAATTEEGFPC